MAFPPGFLDEIRARVPVSEVVGRSVKLIKRGREHSGLCPFHNEKSPSFTVNDDKAFYHCFGCGAHGDVIRFITEKQGLGFIEAVTQLAGEAGLEMPQQSREEREAEETARGLIDLMEDTARWFEAMLRDPSGQGARSYIDKRGLTAETVKTFQLGYAPDGRQRLRQAMQAKGWNDGQLVETGLAILPEDGKEPYDRFRGRLMFPIRDARGRCIAFGGRALSPDAKAKYLNSPETPLFHKGNTLYNLHGARKAAYDTGQVVVAEGYMDVIAMAQAGFKAAVAPLGTALTEQQMKLLWRMADEPTLCFDGDKAGLRAASRSVERALPMLQPGKSLRFALLPEGKDPDDLIKEEGAGALSAVLEKAEPLAQMLWTFATDGKDTSTPERRAAMQKEVYDLVRQIADPTVRSYYESDVRERVRAAFRSPQQQRAGYQPKGGGKPWNSRWGKPPPRGASSYLKTSQLGRSDSQAVDTTLFEKIVLSTVLNHPNLISSHLETLADFKCDRNDIQTALQSILSAFPSTEGLDSEAQKNNLREVMSIRLVDELKRDIFLRSLSFTQGRVEDWQAEAGLLHTLALHARGVSLKEECETVELMLRGDDEAVNQTALVRLTMLKEELAQQNKELTVFDQKLATPDA